jgi:hypothetical protein
MLRSKIRLAILVVLPAILLTAQSSFGGSTIVECKTNPGASARAGLHWYYWTDRTNNRHCWFLTSEGVHVPSHGNVVSRPMPQDERVAERADATPSQNDTVQTTPQIPINPSDDNLVTIAAGNKFQQVIGSNGSAAERRALIIKNNNTNGDTCWVFFGDAKASKEESVILASGGSDVRYWPFVSSDAMLATCASTSDTLYVDVK